MDKNNLNEKNTVKDETKKNSEDIEVLELWEPHADEITDAKDRHIKMSKSSTNKIVIALVLVGALLTVWYAVFAQPLAFNAKQRTSDGKDWQIGFTDIKLADTVGTVRELSKPSLTSSSTASFSVSLTGPGDTAVYDLTIKNSGTINAKVESIYVTPLNEKDDYILYETSDINVGDVLKAGESTHMKVIVTYNDKIATPSISNGESVSKNVTVIINYVEA